MHRENEIKNQQRKLLVLLQMIDSKASKIRELYFKKISEGSKHLEIKNRNKFKRLDKVKNFLENREKED